MQGAGEGVPRAWNRTRESWGHFCTGVGVERRVKASQVPMEEALLRDTPEGHRVRPVRPELSASVRRARNGAGHTG